MRVTWVRSRDEMSDRRLLGSYNTSQQHVCIRPIHARLSRPTLNAGNRTTAHDLELNRDRHMVEGHVVSLCSIHVVGPRHEPLSRFVNPELVFSPVGRLQLPSFFRCLMANATVRASTPLTGIVVADNVTYITCPSSGQSGFGACAAAVGHERVGCHRFRGIQVEANGTWAGFICTCKWYNGGFHNASGHPCIDESCVVGSTACAHRDAGGYLSLVESVVLVTCLLLISSYGVYLCFRSCSTGTCALNVTNLTLMFTTFAAVVHVSWAASDLVQFATLKTVQYEFRDFYAIPIFSILQACTCGSEITGRGDNSFTSHLHVCCLLYVVCCVWFVGIPCS